MTNDPTDFDTVRETPSGTLESFLDQLSTEHDHLIKLIGEIESRIAPLRRAENVDILELLGRVTSLRELFLREHTPGDHTLLAMLLGDLPAEARRVLETTLAMDGIYYVSELDRFESGLRSLCIGQVVRREALVRSARTSMRRLRAQIEHEESAVFPWARSRMKSELRGNVVDEIVRAAPAPRAVDGAQTQRVVE